MNLAEKIIFLRTTHNMSQGDLAEKLSVSRQSVSKWETGTSIPDLEKLVAMSELFHITLDELVKGDNTTIQQDSPEPQVIYIQPPAENTSILNTQRIVGLILLITGLLCIILPFFVSTDDSLTMIGAYLILCSIFCLVVKKNVGIKIAWMTAFLLFVIMMPYGLLVHSAPLIGSPAGNVTVIAWIIMLILAAVTMYKKHKQK